MSLNLDDLDDDKLSLISAVKDLEKLLKDDWPSGDLTSALRSQPDPKLNGFSSAEPLTMVVQLPLIVSLFAFLFCFVLPHSTQLLIYQGLFLCHVFLYISVAGHG